MAFLAAQNTNKRATSGLLSLPPNILQLVCYECLDLWDATNLARASKPLYHTLRLSPMAL